MTDTKGILTALSKSVKGQLKYDKNWHTEGRLKEILEECTSPPKLSPFPAFTPASSTEQGDLSGLGADSEDDDNQDDGVSHHTPSYPPSEDDGDFSSETATESTGLVRSDAERRVIITEKALRQEDEEYRRMAERSIAERRRLYEDHTRMLQRQVENQYKHLFHTMEDVIRQETQRREIEIKQLHDEINLKQQKLKEEHKISAKVLDNKILEAKNKQREEEEKERKKQQAIQDRLAKLEQARADFLKVKAQVSATISNCSNPARLPDSVRKYPDVMHNLSKQVEGILDEVRSSESNSWNVDKLTEYLNKAQDILEFVRKQVEQAEKIAAQELEQKQKEEQQKKLQEQQKLLELQKQREKQQQQLQQQQHQTTATPSTSTLGTSSLSSDQGVLMNSVFKQTLAFYTALTSQQQEVEKRFHKLSTDPQMKKTRFELQKAVNTPINAISPESGRHLRDKLDKITGLLSGQTVIVGEKQVCAGNHEGGIDFCMNLFAKKMVSQGDAQVSAQYDAAFAFAAVIVGVWCELPVVGDLLMAHFYQKCPYLAPYYIPMKEGQTAESYYSSLGYSFEGGQQEKQDMFLKRMSGLMRLYASVMVTSPPRASSRHPHGLDHAWSWLTQVVTLDPRPDITATLLFDFLEVTTHALQKQYKRQFQKLIDYMIQDYLPRIRAATLQGAGGPISRLEILLGKIKKGQVSQPKGMLPARFWLS